jgi:hypothetical protein
MLLRLDSSSTRTRARCLSLAPARAHASLHAGRTAFFALRPQQPCPSTFAKKTCSLKTYRIMLCIQICTCIVIHRSLSPLYY